VAVAEELFKVVQRALAVLAAVALAVKVPVVELLMVVLEQLTLAAVVVERVKLHNITQVAQAAPVS